MEHITHQQNYTKDGVVPLHLISLGLLVLIAILFIYSIVQYFTMPDPLIFKLNKDNQIIEPLSLDTESMSRAALLNWVNDLIVQAFTFNYNNKYKQQKRISDYLDARGMKTYLDLLEEDDYLKMISAKRYVVSAQANSPPEILQDAVVKGRYAWQIRIPITIVLQNSLETRSISMELSLLIWRVPETEVPLGVRVTRLKYKIIGRNGYG